MKDLSTLKKRQSDVNFALGRQSDAWVSVFRDKVLPKWQEYKQIIYN